MNASASAILTALSAPGTVIGGKYRVTRTLGGGGMGVVVEASHARLGQRVAIKLIRPRGKAGSEDHARVLREARIAAQLTSEHVARALDIGETQSGVIFIVMELLEGRDLAVELAERKRIPTDEAVDLVLQAMEGIAEAHGAELVHRDIKPANLFCTKRGFGKDRVIKVLDFGLSKAGGRDGLTGSAGSFGTPQYMSPEQVFSAKVASPQTDQFALGLVLYELVAGRPAFSGRNAAEVATRIVEEAPVPLTQVAPDVPRGLWPILARALEKEPSRRFADLGELAAALAPFGREGATERVATIRAALEAGIRVRGALGTEDTVGPDSVIPAPPALAGRRNLPRIDMSDTATDDDTTVQREGAPRAAPAAPAPPRRGGRDQGAGDTVPIVRPVAPPPAPSADGKATADVRASDSLETLPLPRPVKPTRPARAAAAPRKAPLPRWAIYLLAGTVGFVVVAVALLTLR